MKIFAGFDCGGSNTRCMLVSEDGRELGVGKGGPSNYLFCGKEVAKQSIEDSIRRAFEAAGLEQQPIEGMFIASAAIEVFEGEGHMNFFKEVTGCQQVECDSDIFPVWYAGSRFEPAIAMIAGTGAVIYLLRDNTYIKSSGWGPQFGDEGAGFDIGIHAIQYTARMADLRMDMDDEFYQAVMAHFEVPLDKPHRLLRAVNTGEFRSRVASVTPVVVKLCEQGNPTAKTLISYAADELLLAVKAVAKQVEGQQFALLLSGGLLTNDTPLQKMLLERVKEVPQLSEVQIPDVPAVRSAASIALLRSGRKEAAERLMEA